MQESCPRCSNTNLQLLDVKREHARFCMECGFRRQWVDPEPTESELVRFDTETKARMIREGISRCPDCTG